MIYISNYNQWGSSTLDLAFCQQKHCASIFSFQLFALKQTERIDGKQRRLARELTWVSICEMLQRCKRLQKCPLFSISESTTAAGMPVLLGEGIGAEESSVWVRCQMESSAGGTVDCSEELQASLATWESRIAVSPHSRLECIYYSYKIHFLSFFMLGAITLCYLLVQPQHQGFSLGLGCTRGLAYSRDKFWQMRTTKEEVTLCNAERLNPCPGSTCSSGSSISELLGLGRASLFVELQVSPDVTTALPPLGLSMRSSIIGWRHGIKKFAGPHCILSHKFREKG